MRLGFKIVGVPEVREALSRISDEMAAQKLADAAMSGAGIIENQWKTDAPYKTGQYKRSIHREIVHQDRGRAEVAIGTDIVDPPYPFFLEYGTSRMPPHPSARPAFDKKKEEAAKEIEEMLLGDVDLIWR
jgi:HK97 gp10 family phage protein